MQYFASTVGAGEECRRFESPRLFILLRRQGLIMSRMLVERVYPVVAANCFCYRSNYEGKEIALLD